MNMLQKQTFSEQLQDADSDQYLSLDFLYDLLKRRALYFAIPFFIIIGIGSLIAIAWPAKYLSQGKILVSSQEIPADLVKPTVSALANERIQVIEQRIMTRDNLVTIANKFHITAGWQGLISGTEIIDFIRDRTHIKPLELNLQGERKGAIAFTVGFEYEQPQVATRVANELMTMILNQDVRSRINFASETTRFLEQEVKRLEGEINSTDVQVADLKSRDAGDVSDEPDSGHSKELRALKADLLLKSAIYSNTHPDILAIKRKIAAIQKDNRNNSSTEENVKSEKEGAQKVSSQVGDKHDALQKISSTGSDAPIAGADALLTKRVSLKAELTAAREKLAAARLGESLERGQHSERLEVIEQATLPNKPTSPNRPKIFGAFFVIALMAGGGLVFAAETLNPAIRRTADLASVIDAYLIVSIPYISTDKEVKRKKRTFIWAGGVFATAIVAGAIASIFILPPLDVLFAKTMAAIFR